MTSWWSSGELPPLSGKKVEVCGPARRPRPDEGRERNPFTLIATDVGQDEREEHDEEMENEEENFGAKSATGS